jgi:hypothetical protein
MPVSATPSHGRSSKQRTTPAARNGVAITSLRAQVRRVVRRVALRELHARSGVLHG